jgi:hypothetical protein
MATDLSRSDTQFKKCYISTENCDDSEAETGDKTGEQSKTGEYE